MKKLLTILALFLSLLTYSQNIPEQKQVRITSIKEGGKGKYILSGVTMQGDSAQILYGFHPGLFKSKRKYFEVGDWITVSVTSPKMKGKYQRAIITKNK